MGRVKHGSSAYLVYKHFFLFSSFIYKKARGCDSYNDGEVVHLLQGRGEL